MRKNVLILALCSLAVLSAGCSRSGGENVLSLRHNEVDSLDLSQALSVTQIVPLDNQVPVDKIIQVKRNQSGIYVWAGNQINRYSSDGKYLGIVGREGRGPGEYVSISGFSLSDQEVLLIDSFQRMLVYDLDGEFLRGADIPFYAACGKIFGDRIFLDSGYQSGTEKKFHVFSLETLEELDSFQEIDDAERTYRHIMHAEHYYVTEDNRLLYHEALNNRIYQLYPDRAEVLYSFDFWGKNPPDSFFSRRYKHIGEMVDELSASGYVCGIPRYACGNGGHLMMYLKAGEAGIAFRYPEGKNAVQSRNIYFQNIIRPFSCGYLPMSFNSAKDISFAVPPEALQGASLSEEDNPVLIFAEFRQTME